VKAEDFFTGAPGERRLYDGLLRRLRVEPLSNTSDIDAAIGLLSLVRENLQHVAEWNTPGGVDTDHDIALVLKVLRAVLGRIGVEMPDLPFRDYASLKAVFIRNGWMYNSLFRQEREIFVADFLEPVAAELATLEEAEFARTLADPVPSRPGTGWREVDDELAGLRQAFASASTAQQFSNVGNICVRVLEVVGEVVHDPTRHLQQGESSLPRDKAKDRITRFVETQLSGSAHAELRRLARVAVELAHLQKHRTSPGRRDVGITADAVVLLVSILQRLSAAD
jgi:hypothetical protein